MSYDAREYWATRARKEGKKYVAYKNREGAFNKQIEVFTGWLEAIVPPGGKLLDFGCGVGRFAEFASNWVTEYEGVDITAEALEHAPDLPNCNFTHLESDKLPFPDEHFDGVMAITVLQHIVSPEQFALWASELNRVVRTGGYFFVIDTPAPERKVKMGFHMMWRTAEEISEALGASVVLKQEVNAEFENSHYAFLAMKHGIQE